MRNDLMSLDSLSNGKSGTSSQIAELIRSGFVTRAEILMMKTDGLSETQIMGEIREKALTILVRGINKIGK